MTDPSTPVAGDADGNLYAPPAAQIRETSARPDDAAPFYIVSTAKVAVLTFATFGLYPLYWFWRHWQMHKLQAKQDIWPVPRAIFSVFFAHALFNEIDHQLDRRQVRWGWSPGLWATLYVIAVIASRIADRLPEEVVSAEATMAVMFAALVAVVLSLTRAQRAANLACGDGNAEVNRGFTWANWIWIVLGGLFWLLIGVGMMLPEESQ